LIELNTRFWLVGQLDGSDHPGDELESQMSQIWLGFMHLCAIASIPKATISGHTKHCVFYTGLAMKDPLV
jgi:hypothetical protein